MPGGWDNGNMDRTGCWRATRIACSVFVWQDDLTNPPKHTEDMTNKEALNTTPIAAHTTNTAHPPAPQKQLLSKCDPPARPRLHNRVLTVMVHISRYSFQGRARLAADVGVSRSTISRLINGQTSSSHALVQAVTDALSTELKKPLAPRDLFSPDGCYPERSGCRLCSCGGCLPESAFDVHGRRRVEWLNASPGDWSLAPKMNSEIRSRSD